MDTKLPIQDIKPPGIIITHLMTGTNLQTETIPHPMMAT
jgi:hypothetical protein